MKNYFMTSESVTEGHPDKICDQISDAILDNLIVQDPYSRVAVETMVTTGSVHVAGEVTTRGFADVQQIARRVLKEIGYTNPEFGMDCEDAGVWVSIHGQSVDIAQGVNSDKNKEQGAGDQGMMYGFACNETEELMPMPIIFAHKLTKRLAEVRKSGIIPSLGPDGKSQVTIEYKDNKPYRIEAVVIAQQHKEDIEEDELRQSIFENVIKPVCGKMLDNNTKVHINATGRFVIGGPEGDTGVTGRKIIVDTYGGVGRHGGGAFSGKDPSKVDRSAKYGLRAAARVLVGEGYADRLKIGATYTIGHMHPNSLRIESFGTEHRPKTDMFKRIVDVIGLSVPDMIREMRLFEYRNYQQTARNGHFGHDFPWEKFGNNS